MWVRPPREPVPAVAALVLDGAGRLLLARRAVEPAIGSWDTVGGFIEEDEDALDCVRREALEETGLDVSVGAFVGAFSDRYGDAEDAPTVLNLVWEARVVAGEPRPADDVLELEWFARAALPADNEFAFRWIGSVLREWAARAPQRR